MGNGSSGAGKRRLRAVIASASLAALIASAGSAVGAGFSPQISAQTPAQVPQSLQGMPNGAQALKAEQARQAWLNSSQAKQERRATRSAFAADDRQSIEAALRDKFGNVLDANHEIQPQNVARYTSDYTAVVEPHTADNPGNRSVLAVSDVPMRTQSALGNTQPVDSSLEWQGGDLSPTNPLVDFSLPPKLGEGIDLPANVSVDVPSANAQVAPSVVGNDTALYPNVAPDTDFLASSVPGGVELSNLLRSPESPATQELRLNLPSGAELQPTMDGGAQVVRDGTPALTISPPNAVDAQGQPVPTTMEVSGNTLRVHVDQVNGDWAYPILVDPTVWDDYQWASGSRRGDGWGGFNNGNYSLSNTCMYGIACWGAYGLYIYSWAGRYYPGGAEAGFQYVAPGAPSRSSYIYHVGMYPIFTWQGDSNLSPFFGNLLWWPPGYPDYHYFYGNNNAVGSELWAYNGSHPYVMNIYQHSWQNTSLSNHHVGYVGAITVELLDQEAPTLDPLVSSTGAPHWVSHESATVPLHAHDNGLGVQSFMGVVPDKTTDDDRIVSRNSGKCIDVNAASPYDGAALSQYDCLSPLPANEIFNLIPTSNGYYQLVAENSRKCVEVPGGSTAGVGLDQYKCIAGATNEEWKPVPTTSGYNQLVARHSGQCIAVINASTSNAAGLVQAPCTNGAAHEDWNLIRVGNGYSTSFLATNEAPSCTGANGSMCPVDGHASLPYNTDAMPEGDDHINVQATDPTLNGTPAQMMHVFVDRTGPGVTLKVGQAFNNGGGVVVDPTIGDYAMRVEATDGDSSLPSSERSGVKYIGIKWDSQFLDWRDDNTDINGGAGWGACTTMQQGYNVGSCPHNLGGTIGSTVSGQHQVEVIAKDELGNTTDQTFTVSLPDRTAPQISALGPLMNTSGAPVPANSELDVNATDSGSGVTGVQLLLDGQQIENASQSCSQGGCSLSPKFFEDLSAKPAGAHTVKVVASDAAGNQATQTQTISLDPKAPTLNVSGALQAANGQPLTQQTADASISAVDSAAGDTGVSQIQVKLDDQTVATDNLTCSPGCPSSANTSYTYDKAQQTTPSPHEVLVTATDRAGNTISTIVSVDEVPTPQDVQCPTVDTQTTTPVDPLTPAQAEQAIQGTPSVSPIVAASIPAADPSGDTTDQIDPSLSVPVSPETNYTMTGSSSSGETPTLPAEGVIVGGICLRPTTMTSAASNATVVNGDTALYANTGPQTDTVVRPTAMGATAIENIRGPNAPTTMSWKVGLESGQQLQQLPDGSIAVVDPSAEAPDSIDVPQQPPNADTPAAVPDVATQIADGEYQIAKAEQVSGETVVAVIAPPWVRDSSGQPIPATLTVDSNLITLTVMPWQAPEPIEYPMDASLRMADEDGVSGHYSFSTDSVCAHSGLSDPIGLTFYGPHASVNNVQNTLTWTTPLDQLHGGGPGQLAFVYRRSGILGCTQNDGGAQSGPALSNRYHTRLWLSWRFDWARPRTVGTPHYEVVDASCGNHKVVSKVEGYPTDGFDYARHIIRDNMQQGVLNTYETSSYFAHNTAHLENCDHHDITSDGWRVKIRIPDVVGSSKNN